MVVSNHIYKTAPLWAHGCDVSADCTQRKLSHISLRVVNVVDYSICELLYCAGEPVHFQPLFQEHLLCSISWVCSDMRKKSSMGGGRRGVGQKKNGSTNIWRERGLLSALLWLWCSTYFLSSVGRDQREGSEGREEMSQNSYTNDWDKPCRFIPGFILMYSIYSKNKAKCTGIPQMVKSVHHLVV